MKKVIALLLAAAMAAGLLAGCGGNTNQEEKPSNTPAPVETQEPGGEETDNNQETPSGSGASYEWPQVGSTENVKMVEQEPEKALKFAFLGYSNNSYWDLIYQGVNSATDFLKEHNVTIDQINLGTDIGADVMNNALESCMLQGYDGIICTTFVTGCENYINDCVDAGIPVGIIGGEGAESKRAFCIAGDSFSKSTIAAEYMDKALGGKEGATFGIITSQFSMEVSQKACENCKSILEEKGYKCIGIYEAHDSADECYTVTEQMLTAYPDLGAIYNVSGGTYGMPAAVVDAGKGGEVYLIGHDEISENIEYVRQGVMDAIGQNPAGYAFDAFVYLYNIVVADQYPEESFMAAAAPVVTLDNVDELFPK